MTNHQGHIKLWDELARTGKLNKFWVFGKLFPHAERLAQRNACFACAEAKARYRHEPKCACRRCPITWGNKDPMVHRYFCERLPDSPFRQWRWENIPSKDRKRIAAIIRDLPWREK